MIENTYNTNIKKEEKEAEIIKIFKQEGIKSKNIQFSSYNEFIKHIEDLSLSCNSKDDKNKIKTSETLLYFLRDHKLIYEKQFEEKMKKVEYYKDYNTAQILRNEKKEAVPANDKGLYGINHEIFTYIISNKDAIILNLDAEDIIKAFESSSKISTLIEDFSANLKELKQEFELDYAHSNKDTIIILALNLNAYLQNIDLDYLIKTINKKQNTFLDINLIANSNKLKNALQDNDNDKSSPEITNIVNDSLMFLFETVANNIQTIKFKLTIIDLEEKSKIAKQLRL